MVRHIWLVGIVLFSAGCEPADKPITNSNSKTADARLAEMTRTMPSASAEPERYKGRPLLLILENYVLDCIGELSPETQDTLRVVVQKAFGGDSDWKKTIRKELRLDDSFDDEIRTMWSKNQEIARQNNTKILPVQFAKMVVDENFADVATQPSK